MITDTLSESRQYEALHPLFASGFEYLRHFAADTPSGRYEIEGDRLFALVQSYDTRPPEQKKFESHEAHADIQYIVSGSENIYYAHRSLLPVTVPYNPEKDVQLYGDPTATTVLRMEAGSFAIFFPADGHKPNCHADGLAQVTKVVLKVRL